MTFGQNLIKHKLVGLAAIVADQVMVAQAYVSNDLCANGEIFSRFFQ